MARELRLETEAFIIKAANAESKGGVWKLEGVGIETRAGGAAALKLEAPAAVFEAQTGRINADGGIRARLGELELHAASLSVDAATDSYRLEGELRVATRGLSLAGESLHGRLSDSGDFVVSKARLRLNMNDGE